jgi:hypothetical protein
MADGSAAPARTLMPRIRRGGCAGGGWPTMGTVDSKPGELRGVCPLVGSVANVGGVPGGNDGLVAPVLAALLPLPVGEADAQGSGTVPNRRW